MKYGKKRLYIGSYATRQEAQQALDDFVKNVRPELYNATLGYIYKQWSEIHYKQISKSAIDLYSAMWKHFSDIRDMPMSPQILYFHVKNSKSIMRITGCKRSFQIMSLTFSA